MCEVDQRTNQTYCDPSCLNDNGGCDPSDICSIVKMTCVESPCLSIVQCRRESVICMCNTLQPINCQRSDF